MKAESKANTTYKPVVRTDSTRVLRVLETEKWNKETNKTMKESLSHP